jgi:hypothetical protein
MMDEETWSSATTLTPRELVAPHTTALALGSAPDHRICLAGWQAGQRLVDAILVTIEPSLVRERHVEPDTPVKAATSTA